MIPPDFLLPLFKQEILTNSKITDIDFHGLANEKDGLDEYKPMH